MNTIKALKGFFSVSMLGLMVSFSANAQQTATGKICKSDQKGISVLNCQSCGQTGEISRDDTVERVVIKCEDRDPDLTGEIVRVFNVTTIKTGDCYQLGTTCGTAINHDFKCDHEKGWQFSGQAAADGVFTDEAYVVSTKEEKTLISETGECTSTNPITRLIDWIVSLFD